MEPKSKEIYMYALGAVVVLGVLGVIALLVFFEMPTGNKDALLLVLGTLVASFSAVVGYFYGSSKGSADKTDLLKK